MTPETNLDIAGHLRSLIAEDESAFGEIRTALGLSSEAAMTAILSGDLKVPLDKIPRLAKALGMPVEEAFKLAFRQWPKISDTFGEVMDRVVSPSELDLVKAVRALTGDRKRDANPSPSPATTLEASPTPTHGAVPRELATGIETEIQPRTHEMVDLNFKVDPALKEWFRAAAFSRRSSMKGLLVAAVLAWLEEANDQSAEAEALRAIAASGGDF